MSSSGISFSCAIFKRSFRRFMLINAVVTLAIGSRSAPSKAGRKSGSKRRSNCKQEGKEIAQTVQEHRTVLARGAERLGFELKGESALEVSSRDAH
jgi:hypothetical protein